MKRYLLFFGDAYYPSGGWGDFHGDFDSMEDAIQFSLKYRFDWLHIIDGQTKEKVFIHE